mmetsp:Transcript_869/g.2809  ORF Transcript_869/g.2809 Transcript_869/m.2809 type:complete len:163 (+) Transcript_869:189-677(+)
MQDANDVFKKRGGVNALKHKGAPRRITTVTSDGVETTNMLQEGDWLVMAVPMGEEYVVKPDKFAARYGEDKPSEPKEANGRSPDELTPQGFHYYPALGKVLRHQVTSQDIETRFPSGRFMAPWGESMVVNSGDSLVIPFPSASEIYRIGAAEFEATYEPDAP